MVRGIAPVPMPPYLASDVNGFGLCSALLIAWYGIEEIDQRAKALGKAIEGQ